MSFTFLSHLREIDELDERLITLTILLDIAQNILADRNNVRHHTLPGEYVQEMFSKYPGALECLNAIGFHRDATETDLIFDQSTPVKHVEQIVQLLQNEMITEEPCQVRCNTTDFPSLPDDDNGRVSVSFHDLHLSSRLVKLIPFVAMLTRVQSYEDISLRRYIRSSILPLNDFNRRIQIRHTECQIDRRDLLLLEMLKWFKEEFFTWFDRPTCDRCKITMNFLENGQPTREERDRGDAHNVEVYRCSTCSSEYRFPRFNAPWVLLETRRGRCGEAAILFACLCRAVSFETRHIFDTTDHVWAEVYSMEQQRWLHCDCCENLCDSPLVYERGWKKHLSYCIAIARDHVQDVTWRYVTNFKETRQRRTNISEKILAKTISLINQRLQSQLDQQEKQQVIKSQVQDLANMLCEVKSTKESESHGRQSGSLAWKLSRGETLPQADVVSGYIFSVTDEECRRGLFSLQYDSVFDRYYRNGIEQEKTSGWADRVYSCSNIQRKVEQDWHMVYLCRREQGENSSTGSISWLIQLDKDLGKTSRFDRITLQYPSITFDPHARVQWQLYIGEKTIIDLPEGSNTSFEYCIDDKESYSDHLQLRLIATLNSSNDSDDNNAWQKSQLFRQSTEHPSHSEQSHRLQITVTIVDQHVN